MSAATLDEPKALDPSTASQFETSLLHLVGEPFLFLQRAYGDELILHFGERAVGSVRSTKCGGFQYEHGTFSVHLRGSAWLIKSAVSDALFTGGIESEFTKALGEPTRRADAVAECPLTAGAIVTSTKPFLYSRPPVEGIGLRIDLSDGATVIAIPTPDEPEPLSDVPTGAEVCQLADWELKTPRFVLEAGPGRRWHVRLPNVPAAR